MKGYLSESVSKLDPLKRTEDRQAIFLIDLS